MSKKLTYSGNVELLRKVNNPKVLTELEQGKNIKLTGDVNRVNIATTDDVEFNSVVINNKDVENELKNKYDVQQNIQILDNLITLQLGKITGLQVPDKDTDAANKRYVDDVLNDFWKQLQQMHFVNFKGKYNSKLTYDFGDLVVFEENNENYFYLSIKELNNSPLTDNTSWIKLSTPVPNNLVTMDIFDELVKRVDELEKEVDELKKTPNVNSNFIIVALNYWDGTLTINQCYDILGNVLKTSYVNITAKLSQGSTNEGKTITYETKGGSSISYSSSTNSTLSFNYMLLKIECTINNVSYTGAVNVYLKAYNDYDYVGVTPLYITLKKQ